MKIVTNPDKRLVEEIRERIKQNQGHCPCAITFTDENKCMCKDFKEQIGREEPGYCHCGLYAVIND